VGRRGEVRRGAAAGRDRGVEVRVWPGEHAAGEFAAAHRDLFDRNYALGEKLLESGLIWPALEFCLKCSHLFNILDSSGSIGVTERTAYILKVRQLAVKVARAYVDATVSEPLA
jgi:glycyl-tRNA synthetase alpha chain